VQPWLGKLEGLPVETLVFVPDALLRGAPVAALHDGERHLVERFSLAITPGLELTDPRPLPHQEATALLGGLSDPVEGFARLDNVGAELRSISELFPSEVLLDQSFRTEDFERALRERDFSVVHLATHAEFGGESGESFILTQDGRLTLDQLGEYAGYARFRERPIELLTLSACETAQGDERAALGLAGVAVKAGVRSAIGTLWKVNDPASATLLTAFYRELRASPVSKAEALRRAQLSLQSDPRYRHPYFWAPFLLISNWL
jgi:CHAT domain-containing protein